jgi:hypothetical protein
VHCVDPATENNDPKCFDCLKKCDGVKTAEEWRVCMHECLRPGDIIEKRQVRSLFRNFASNLPTDSS